MKAAVRTMRMSPDEMTSPARRSSATPSGRQPQSSLAPEVSAYGRPLDAQTRTYFEDRFHHDFSRVRVHADGAAASSASSLGAMAYTVGRDIAFGHGGYNPGSEPGRRLLAHELAHVVQQQNTASGTVHAAEYEAEAARASNQAARGGKANVRLAAPRSIQRQALPGQGQGLPAAVPQLDLTEQASPRVAAMIGSVSLDGFDTGKSDVSSGNEAKLAQTVETIMKLLKNYPASTIRVIGYTDAIGQENDNQALGQARADSVRNALLKLGLPDAAVRTESRGANDLLVKTRKAEPRNRRVEVQFAPSTFLRGAMSKGLMLGSGTGSGTAPATQPAPGGIQGGLPGIGDLCVRDPTLCYGKGQGFPGGPPTVPPAALQPIPDNTPYNRMDVQGVNAAYTSHGRSPQEGGDLRQIWGQMYWKYRRHFSEDKAVALANSELSATAGKEQSRDNPNAADELDTEMKRAYPNSTTVGPANITLFKF